MNNSFNECEQTTADQLRVVGLGEILWDVFPTGPRFGGAPANFACSMAGLADGKVHVFMAGAVGQDEFGCGAIDSLREHHVATSCVAVVPQETGQVLVQVDPEGHASYEFKSDAAWDNFPWSPELEQLAVDTDAVCFGTLGQRSQTSRQTIQRFVSTTSPTSLRIFDINLRPPFVDNEIILESLAIANVLKLNEDELPALAKLCDLQGSDLEILQRLAQRFQLRAIAYTQGADGAMLMKAEEVCQHSGVKTDVVDTVGAGDAFTAAFILGLLRDESLDAIIQAACNVASFVCSQSGATPKLPG